MVAATRSKEKEQGKYEKPIVVEILPAAEW